MFKVDNLFNNENVRVIDHRGMFAVIEYVQDRSVNKGNAIVEFFASKMKARRRQVVCFLKNQSILTNPNDVQWTLGDIKSKSNANPVSDIIEKFSKGKNSKDAGLKPKYYGSGYIVLEPRYKYLTLVDLNDWENDVVIADNSFYVCDANLQQKLISRSSLANMVTGSENIMNLNLKGEGILCVESNYPRDELIEINLKDDVLKLDGEMAVIWSGSLDFSLERITRLGMPPTASESYLNVFKGTGKVLLSPVSR